MDALIDEHDIAIATYVVLLVLTADSNPVLREAFNYKNKTQVNKNFCAFLVSKGFSWQVHSVHCSGNFG